MGDRRKSFKPFDRLRSVQIESLKLGQKFRINED
jgi:hypothetical protein